MEPIFFVLKNWLETCFNFIYVLLEACAKEVRNIDQMQQLAKGSIWLAHVARLWTCIIDSKKQASRGLNKTIDHAR
jgi:hypothetical protein